MEFNRLPMEIQLEIFSYLPVRQVMKIRRVCKQWNGLINSEFKFKRLSCNESSYLGWYDFHFISTRTFLDYTSNDPKFSRVRCLEARLRPLYNQLEDAFDFPNSFRSLEDLKITYYIRGPRRFNSEELKKKKLVLCLDRLKKAEISLSSESDHSKVSVLLDLRSLQHLKINTLKNFTIAYPEKLRTLAIIEIFHGDPDYSKFTNLRQIYTNSKNVSSISASFIGGLPSLQELHLGSYSNCDRSIPSSDKASVRVFYFGFEFDFDRISLEQFPSVSFSFHGLNEDSTEFIARNLHRSIDNNPFLTIIDYNAWVRAFDDIKMVSVMLKKFPNIRSLYITGAVANENRLLRFIDQFKIQSFNLERASLSQAFFKNLPEYGPFINRLVIKSEPTMDILSGDFDFVLKMKLRSFDLEGCSLPLNFVIRLLRELKSIKYIIFNRPEIYGFYLSLDWSIDLEVYETGFKSLSLKPKFTAEEAAELIENLSSPLKINGFVCPQKLLTRFCLHPLQLEEQTGLFMMRKYIYDHKHSICLSREQMRLLNLLR